MIGMDHFSIQEVRVADWADLKLACIEVNKQSSYALKAARFKSAQTVPLPPVLSRSPVELTVLFPNGHSQIDYIRKPNDNHKRLIIFKTAGSNVPSLVKPPSDLLSSLTLKTIFQPPRLRGEFKLLTDKPFRKFVEC